LKETTLTDSTKSASLSSELVQEQEELADGGGGGVVGDHGTT
jgi:hypothetical protein